MLSLRMEGKRASATSSPLSSVGRNMMMNASLIEVLPSSAATIAAVSLSFFGSDMKPSSRFFFAGSAGCRMTVAADQPLTKTAFFAKV